MPGPHPAYRGSEPYVFVSYSHADGAIVYDEIRRLQDQGINVWYDTTGISAGAEWSNEIAAAIRDATSFLFFISPDSVASEHCRRELSFAQSVGRQVIVVHLQETEIPDGLRLSLENRQAILRHRLTADAYSGMLSTALTDVDQRPPTQPLPATKEASPPTPNRRPTTIAASLLIVTVAIVAWFWWDGTLQTGSQDQTIAVLPFLDLSSGTDQQHFGDGVAEEILDELTGLDGLRVVARSSSFAYRDDRRDLGKIADTLGATTILDGSIRRSGDRIRITAQLINAEDGLHLWSDIYERELTDLFAIQDEIAAEVAGALGVTLGVGDINAYSGAGTSSAEAYEAFLKAQNNVPTESIRLLKRAVALDPEYAAAWAALGLVTAQTMWLSAPEDAPEILEEAIEHLLRAVQLEPNSAYAYSLLGTVNYARMDWAQSEEYFQQSLAISSDREALSHYGNMLMRSGRSSAAIGVWQSANLPVNSISRNAYLAMGKQNGTANLELLPVDHYLTEYPEAIDLSEKAEAFLLSASAREGVAWREFVESLSEKFTDREQALLVLESTLEDPNAIWPSKHNDIALLAAAYRAPELALKAIAFESRLTTIRLFSLWYPVMRDVRRQPGFKTLMEEINLPDYWRKYGWPDHCRPLGETDFECS